MLVRKLRDIPEEKSSGGIFTGEVTIQKVFGKETSSTNLNVSIVSFPPKIKNKWHTHNYDQCLWILSGKGKVASKEAEYEAETGMVFFIPSGESHWHGSDGYVQLTHISIIGGIAP